MLTGIEKQYKLPNQENLKDKFNDLLRPYLINKLGIYVDPSGFSRSYFKRILQYHLRGRRACKNKKSVKTDYERAWRNRILNDYTPLSSNSCLGNWNGEQFEFIKTAPKRIHLYLLGGILRVLQPRSVLELGCGMGVNLAFLSRAYPDVEFAGIELTRQGVLRCRKNIAHTPQQLIEFYPRRLKSARCQMVSPILIQGSAQNVPLRDASFELVFTMQALEQMNPIRNRVLSEIHRVTSGFACFFEAFADYNKGELRLNILERNYFGGSLQELRKHGFRVLTVYDNLPTKNKMKVVCVVAEKVAVG